MLYLPYFHQLMKTNSKITLIALSATLIAALMACSKQTLKVSPIGDGRYNGRGLIYSLPRNVLHVQVHVNKTTYTPGPYASFAKKLLGVEQAILEPSTLYTITEVAANTSVEADPNALFCAYGKPQRGRRTIDYFSLCASGLVLPIDQPRIETATQNKVAQAPNTSAGITDMSPSPFLAETQNTIYSKNNGDNELNRAPVLKNIIVERNLAEKAKEAADFIFMLRQKRLEFLTTDPETPFTGDALRAAFDEINRLEHAYVSLFVGYTESCSEIHTFSYTPTKAEGESDILFRFSKNRGIVGVSDFTANPVLLSITPDSIPVSHREIAEAVNGLKAKKRNMFVHYRMPNMATISLSEGKTELLTTRKSLYQYGTTCLVPLSQLETQ